MDELACFAPGMLALGASGYNDPAEAKKFLTLAEEVKLWLDINRIFKQFMRLELSPLFIFFPLICSLHGHVITSTNQHQQNWLGRIISSTLGVYVLSLFGLCLHLLFSIQSLNMIMMMIQDMSVGTSWNILRPETVESLFYLWRLTGNKTYQDWGWNIFEAFEKNSRIESGYVGLKDVRSP